MTKHGVTIIDLHATSKMFASDWFTQPGYIHFMPKGWRSLADQVASAIFDKLMD